MLIGAYLVLVLTIQLKTLDEEMALSTKKSAEASALLRERENALRDADAQLKSAVERATNLEEEANRCGSPFVFICGCLRSALSPWGFPGVICLASEKLDTYAGHYRRAHFSLDDISLVNCLPTLEAYSGA